MPQKSLAQFERDEVTTLIAEGGAGGESNALLEDVRRFKAHAKKSLADKEAKREKRKTWGVAAFLRRGTDPILNPFRPEIAMQRHYTRSDLWHYWTYWTLGASCCGLGIGFLSFLRRRNYRNWVFMQPKEVQMKILAEQSILSSEQVSVLEAQKLASTVSPDPKAPSVASSKYLQTRFSTLPKAMDTRPVLSFSGDLRPSQWYEFGPLRYYNQKANYPWASELMTECAKWSLRMGLVTGLTLGLEVGVAGLLFWELGSNVALRGACGAGAGWLLSRGASGGRLYYYQSLYLSLGLGAAIAVITWYQNDWAEVAKNNYSIVTKNVPMFDKAIKKRRASEEDLEQLALKYVKDRSQAIAEQVERDPEAFETMSAEDKVLAYVDWKDYAKWRGIELKDEVDQMSYEARKAKQIKMSGDNLGMDYDSFPAKYFRKELPQWHVLDSETVGIGSDTSGELDIARDMTRGAHTSQQAAQSNDAGVSPILLT